MQHENVAETDPEHFLRDVIVSVCLLTEINMTSSWGAEVYTPSLVRLQCLLLELYLIALLVLKRIQGATGLFCLAFFASFFLSLKVFCDG